jgi:hypothetical protein
MVLIVEILQHDAHARNQVGIIGRYMLFRFRLFRFKIFFLIFCGTKNNCQKNSLVSKNSFIFKFCKIFKEISFSPSKYFLMFDSYKKIRDSKKSLTIV